MYACLTTKTFKVILIVTVGICVLAAIVLPIVLIGDDEITEEERYYT